MTKRKDPKDYLKEGRPTLYHDDMPSWVNEYVELEKSYGAERCFPTVEGVALYIGVNIDTIAEWRKKYPEFSEAIKKVLLYQAVLLQKGVTLGKMNPAGAIFLLKNNHGFKDKTETDITTNGKDLPVPIWKVDTSVQTDDSLN